MRAVRPFMELRHVRSPTGRRILTLVLIMTAVATGVGSIALVTLYRTSIRQETARLIETAQTQARLMEAMARYDSRFSREDVPGGSFAATLQQITDAHQQFEGFGETREFTLAQRAGEEIVFLLRHRYGDVDRPAPVLYSSDVAEPTRRALSGESGSLVGRDYRGVRVIAAYEPVSELNLGLVAKIDMAEVRAPFLKTGLLVAGTGAGLIVAGAGLFLLVGKSITRRVEQSEESLAEAQEIAHLGSWTWNAVTGEAQWSNECYRIFGYSPGAIEPDFELVLDAIHPDDREAVRRAIDGVVKTGGSYDQVYRIIRPDGAQITLHSRASTRLDDKGKVIQMVGTVEDITERSRAEEELRRHGVIVASSTDMLALVDRKFTYLAANTAYLEAFGKNHDQVVGHTVTEVFGEEFFNAVIGPNAEPCLAGEEVHYQAWFNFPATGKTYVDVNCSPYINADNEVAGFVVNARDITQRHQAQETLRRQQEQQELIFDSVPATIYFKDTDNRLIWVNRAGAETAGMARGEMEGRTLFELFPDLAEDSWRDDLEIFASGQPKKNIIERLKTPSGTRWVQTDKIPYRDEAGQVTGIIGLSTDITERLQVEDELRASRNELLVRSRISHSFLTLHDDDMYQEVLDAVLEALHSKLGFFGYINQQGGLTCPSMTRGVWERCQVADKNTVFPRSAWGGIWGRSLIERRAIYSNDSLRPPEGHVPLKNTLAAPILLGDEVIGQLVVGNKDSDYDEADKMRLEAIANHVAPVLHARLSAAQYDETRRQAEETMHASRERLRNLAVRLHAVREEERTVIAREMHDELGQALTGVRMDLQWLMDKLPRNRKALYQRAGAMLSLVDSTIETVREIAWRLKPPILDDLGLTAAIEWYANEFKEHSALELQLDLTKEEPVLDPARAMTVFRICQEALTNVARHAEASRVELTMRVRNHKLVLEIADDGIGITKREIDGADALGLIGMRERAGSFGGRVAIKRQDEGGTKVKLTLPLQ